MLKIKKLYLFTLLTVLLSVSFIFTQTVNAEEASNLVVKFNPSPLFSAVNFMPGGTTMAKIEVSNFSGVTKPIAIEAVNEIDPDHLGDVLNLEIKEGSNTILNKSLTEFFNQGETFLSNLASNASTTYDLILTFKTDAGNAYQGKVLNNFDILVGFQGDQTAETSPGQGSIGSGGGAPLGLMISNDANINILSLTADSVIITWQTNYFSTSRVIYAAENEAHDFDYGNPSNYGYAHSTADDLTKVTYHQVRLTGLTPDTLYYYRVISHASPDTVGRSYAFRTLPLSESNIDKTVAIKSDTQEVALSGGNIASSGVISGGSVNTAVKSAEQSENNKETSTTNGKVLAETERGDGGQSTGWLSAIGEKWSLAIIVIILIIIGIKYWPKNKAE